jgi:hypothetical protein
MEEVLPFFFVLAPIKKKYISVVFQINLLKNNKLNTTIIFFKHKKKYERQSRLFKEIKDSQHQLHGQGVSGER